MDMQGRVSNLRYVQWMQDLAVAHSAANGWSMERYAAVGQGWVVRQHRITYRKPAVAGQVISGATWVADFASRQCTRRYLFSPARMRLSWRKRKPSGSILIMPADGPCAFLRNSAGTLRQPRKRKCGQPWPRGKRASARKQGRVALWRRPVVSAAFPRPFRTGRLRGRGVPAGGRSRGRPAPDGWAAENGFAPA